MSAMKPRIPDTLEDAITIIIAALGGDECGRIIGKSRTLVHYASDPDHDFMLNLHQALALDRAYTERTGLEPPILRVMQRELGQPGGQGPQAESGIKDQVLKLTGDIGKTAEDLLEATAKGGQLSPNAAIGVMRDLDRVERDAQQGKRALKAEIDGKGNRASALN